MKKIRHSKLPLTLESSDHLTQDMLKAIQIQMEAYSWDAWVDEDRLQELLTITMEECGELIQACSKSIRCDDYYNNDKLTEEVGDVMCMIELLHEYDLISYNDVEDRVKVKKEKLKKWSSLYETRPD